MNRPRPQFGSSARQVAVASFVALLLSGSPLIVYAQSVFLEPMTQEFGWSRSEYFLPLSIGGLAGALATPYTGFLADRYGVRRLLIPGVALFGLSYAALGLINDSVIVYAFLILALILSQNAHGTMLYTKAVALWPANRPGFLLAVALAGTAVGGMIVPPLAVYLIEAFGWRGARLGLGLAVLLIALPAAWLFVKPPGGRNQASPVECPEIFGVSAAAALRSPTFWYVALAISLSGMGLNALLANIVPILRSHGFSPALSASALSVIAGAMLVARFGSGYLLDRFNTPKVGLLWFSLAVIGIAIVMATTSTVLMLSGMFLLGVGLGAEMELAAYFTRRYFGTKNYGQIYGYILGLFTVGATSGPLILGAAYDLSGGYTIGILAAEALLFISILLILRLAPYSYGIHHSGLSGDADGLAKTAHV